MNTIIPKSQMTEEDIKLNFITPALQNRGWADKITMETKVQFTDGKINLRGNLVSRAQPKKADYVLYVERNYPIAIVEAKDNHHSVSFGLQQAITYGKMLDVPFQLLSSFDGKQVYPKQISKEEVFKEATEERTVKANWDKVPDGIYHLDNTKRGTKKAKATMRVEDGAFIVEKGSTCLPLSAPEGWMPEARREAVIKDGILQEDAVCNSPSTAGWIVLGHANNGWLTWKDAEGNYLDEYR